MCSWPTRYIDGGYLWVDESDTQAKRHSIEIVPPAAGHHGRACLLPVRLSCRLRISSDRRLGDPCRTRTSSVPRKPASLVLCWFSVHMESCRSPSASITPFSAGQLGGQLSGCWWTEGRLKVQLVSKRDRFGRSPIRLIHTGGEAPGISQPAVSRLKAQAHSETKLATKRNLDVLASASISRSGRQGYKAASAGPPGRG
jgi:hypothetical protein